MIAVADIVPPDGVLLHLKASTLDEAINQISALAAEVTGQRAIVIQEALMSRARLGASLGDGVVIPHARLPGLRRIVGFFARPLTPIKQDNASDIHMLFVLLAPEDADAEHLKLLAQIARLLRDPESHKTLLSGNRDEVYNLLIGG